MKPSYRIAFLALAILAVSSVLFAHMHYEDRSMKLVNVTTGFVVVEFKNGQPHFGDRFLEAEMKDMGILIPQNCLADFEYKKIIYLSDPLFQKAFHDIYVPLYIASSLYQWKE